MEDYEILLINKGKIKIKKRTLYLLLLTVFLMIHGCKDSTINNSTSSVSLESPEILQTGWVIGFDENNTAVILHTDNGGKEWVVQGDNTQWIGCNGYDISAVDNETAWAALAGKSLDGIGKILHTTNGGVTWSEQILPKTVDSGIKSIKGLSRNEAWAVSFAGTILHTTDGGKVWNVVDHPNVEIKSVNRMDVISYTDTNNTSSSIDNNIWIVDEDGGNFGMIHSSNNGDTWRAEYIENSVVKSGTHMVSAYSSQVVWAAKRVNGNIYRTADGGETWKSVTQVGPNDIDDMCGYSADALWFVQYQSGYIQTGNIYHFNLEDEKAEQFTPVDQYKYEGLTCLNDQTAIVVGYTDVVDPPQQRGLIIVTNDGGKTWENQPLPVDDVSLWKVSFVGLQR